MKPEKIRPGAVFSPKPYEIARLYFSGQEKLQLTLMGFHQSGTPPLLSVWRYNPRVLGGEIR